MYADNVLLYSYIKSESDCHALQEDLDALAQWARIWLMEFNPSKCEFLRITNKKNPIVFNYCIEAVPIAQVAHTKYLGVTISSNLSWNEHVQRIINQAKQVKKLFVSRHTVVCRAAQEAGAPHREYVYQSRYAQRFTVPYIVAECDLRCITTMMWRSMCCVMRVLIKRLKRGVEVQEVLQEGRRRHRGRSPSRYLKVCSMHKK